MNARWSWALAGLLVVLIPTTAGAQEIFQRISVKFILDAGGSRPPGPYSTNASVSAAVDTANAFVTRMGRGYAFQIIEFQDVSGASQYYDLSSGESYSLEISAKANPAQYHWRTDAINLFIVNSNTSGGAAAIPSNPSDSGYRLVVWMAGIDPYYNDIRMPHELGHHNDLYHPWDSNWWCGTWGDCVADTRPEPTPFACTTPFGCTTGGSEECCCSTKTLRLALAKIAGGWTAQEYDDLRWNVMGYFGADDCVNDGAQFTAANMRLTDGQLDRWSDATREYHPGEVTGFTRFVDLNATNPIAAGWSYDPYLTVQFGVNAANAAGGDIVLIRAGTYPENITITKPVTLRASRGVATIGQ